MYSLDTSQKDKRSKSKAKKDDDEVEIRGKSHGKKEKKEHSSTRTVDLIKRGEKDVPEDEDIELEEFEMGASQFVSKKEAKKVYLLPEGTLSVCDYVEKSNPKSSKFSAMKLYHRAEIRRRSRERFGGLDGLREERASREKKRFERDYKCAEEIFEKKSKR